MNPEDIGIPKRQFETANHMTKVEGADGYEYRILVDLLTDDRHIVPNEIVEYGRLHPLNKGFIGFLATLLAFIIPLWAGIRIAITTGGTLATIGITAVTIIGSYLIATVVYERTIIGEWLWQFLQYNKHKSLILRGGSI